MQAWPALVPPPYTAEWNWMSVRANKDASPTLDDATLTMDGGDGGYNVNIEGSSTYTSDHCRSGFTGTFIVTVDNSTVTANNNDLTDIIFAGKGKFKSANVQISGTKGTSCWYTAKEQQLVDGWTFDGWYADEDCTAKWDDDAELATFMTLFGKWTKNADPDQ